MSNGEWRGKKGRGKRSIPAEDGGVRWHAWYWPVRSEKERSVFFRPSHRDRLGAPTRPIPLAKFVQKSGMRKRTQHIRTQCTRFSYKIKSFKTEACPDLNEERTQKPTTTKSSPKSRHYINTPVWPNNNRPKKNLSLQLPSWAAARVHIYQRRRKNPGRGFWKKGSVEEEEREKAERSNAVRCGWGGVSTLPRL